MANNTINILCTRPIPDELLSMAKRKGVNIEILSFIDTVSIDTIDVQQEIENSFLKSATVVLTSMNAVEAVATYLEDQEPDWQIYTMGVTCKELVKEYFGEDSIAGTASSAKELAELIVEDSNTSEVIFFCGDQRRDELPSILESNNIEVFEIEVYHTIPTPHKISKHYDGILFFSPSAVRSFFQKNKSEPNSIFFAIGETTSQEIEKFTKNKVIVSSESGKESLVKEMLEFFKG